uniref:Uncharacterized protein n=1 Tax=Anopheles farauti TaxID=69004 RepID=A0A182QKP0_9DIPT
MSNGTAASGTGGDADSLVALAQVPVEEQSRRAVALVGYALEAEDKLLAGGGMRQVDRAVRGAGEALAHRRLQARLALLVETMARRAEPVERLALVAVEVRAAIARIGRQIFASGTARWLAGALVDQRDQQHQNGDK